MKFQDYYAALGVPRDASADDVKRAYRRLARKYHPDVSKERDAEARFKEIAEAYEVLKDPQRRAAYDEVGRRWGGRAADAPPQDWDQGFEFGEAPGHEAFGGDFSEFFETLFGGGRFRAGGSHHPLARGEDHHAKVLVDLEEAFSGATRTIALQAPELDNSGAVRLRERRLEVRIPAGVRPGQHLRLPGQGGRGLGDAPAGDLLLEVELRPHPLYGIDGRDLTLELPVAPWEAALGAHVKAPTPAGLVELRIPAGSRAGTRLRLKGRGLPGEPAGDLYVALVIAGPPADTPAREAAYRALAQASAGFDPRAALGVRTDSPSATGRRSRARPAR